MGIKDFDAAVKAKEPKPFRVAGQVFTARKSLPWRTLVKLQKQLEQAPTDEDFDDTQAIRDFFGIVLARSDRERFLSLLDENDEEDDDSDNQIYFEQLSEIMEWLFEEYTGKASTTEESSSDGQSTTGQS